MITVVVGLDTRGNLVSAEASGHAGKGKPGTDIVCAAVTVLMRTTMAVLAGQSGREGNTSGSGPAVEAKTAGRGSLVFRVTAYEEGDHSLLKYAAVFLQEGIGSLAREYPDAVEMRVGSVC